MHLMSLMETESYLDRNCYPLFEIYIKTLEYSYFMCMLSKMFWESFQIWIKKVKRLDNCIIILSEYYSYRCQV